MKTYEQEKSQELEFLIDNIFLKNYINNTKNTKLELMITPKCNLNCSYCYLAKFGDELYPKEFQDENLILNNLNKFLDYMKLHTFHVDKLDLFSGEIWHTKFGQNFLTQLLLKYKSYKYSNAIIIPTNGTFVKNPQTLEFIQNIIDQFNLLNVRVYMSLSIDGKIIEDSTRPFKDTSLSHDDNFYDNLVEFAKYNNYGFHPMVSAKSIKYWIDNYNWFQDIFKKHQYINPVLMMLEVRNDDWSLEDINDYCNFLTHIIYSKIGINMNLQNLYEFLFTDPNFSQGNNYNNIMIVENGNRVCCSLQQGLHIRLGDLAIIPCHRLCYDHNLFGYFEDDTNGDLKIVAKNIDLASYIWQLNPNLGSPSCDTCKYKKACMKGCLGSQYEVSKDLTLPNESVCNLFKAKIDYLSKLYIDIGFIDFLEQNYLNQPAVQCFVTMIKQFGNQDRNNYDN